MTTFTKEISFLGEIVQVSCDGKCSFAWGLSQRPRKSRIGEDGVEVHVDVPDTEAGEAPYPIGTYEGGHTKPKMARSGQDMNKWCVRECERCKFHAPTTASA